MASPPPTNEPKTAQYWIDKLGLQGHPEGGYCRELTRGNYIVSAASGKHRFAYSTIYFLLTPESSSHLHRLPSDEVWVWHAGDAIDVHVIYKRSDDDCLLTREEGGGPRTDSESLPANASFVPPFVAEKRRLAAHEEEPYAVYRAVRVGPDVEKGDVLQYVVPAGAIFGSSLAPGGSAGYTLVSCMVSPGFDYRDFELFTQEQLLELCPQHESIIRRLAYETLPPS